MLHIERLTLELPHYPPLVAKRVGHLYRRAVAAHSSGRNTRGGGGIRRREKPARLRHYGTAAVGG